MPPIPSTNIAEPPNASVRPESSWVGPEKREPVSHMRQSISRSPSFRAWIVAKHATPAAISITPSNVSNGRQFASTHFSTSANLFIR